MMPVSKKKPAQKKKTAAKKTGKKTTPKKTAKKKAVAKKAASKPAVNKKATPKTTAKKASGRRSITATATALEGFTPYKEKSGEHYMNKNQMAHFRNLLETWKHELMEEVDRTVHHMQDDAANFPDPNDRATQESEFALELRTRDRERKLIKKIDESLECLDNEEYGYCEVCGVEIGIRRLEARPTATLCIDCKTLDEIREKQMRG
jgi:DnaK suppressor protein